MVEVDTWREDPWRKCRDYVAGTFVVICLVFFFHVVMLVEGMKLWMLRACEHCGTTCATFRAGFRSVYPGTLCAWWPMQLGL